MYNMSDTYTDQSGRPMCVIGCEIAVLFQIKLELQVSITWILTLTSMCYMIHTDHKDPKL